MKWNKISCIVVYFSISLLEKEHTMSGNVFFFTKLDVHIDILPQLDLVTLGMKVGSSMIQESQIASFAFLLHRLQYGLLKHWKIFEDQANGRPLC